MEEGLETSLAAALDTLICLFNLTPDSNKAQRVKTCPEAGGGKNEEGVSVQYITFRLG